MRVSFNTDWVSVSKPEPHKDGVWAELGIDDPTMRDLIIRHMNRVFPTQFFMETFILNRIPKEMLFSYVDGLRGEKEQCGPDL